MTRVLLVPDLPLERWPSMDRYAHRLHDWLESTDPGFEVRLAASIGDLTRDRGNGRTSGGYPRWWAQDVDPTKFVLPGPLHEPQRYVARYVLYPWWLRREAKRAQLVHILDHSYAHMVTRVQRRPAIVTVHDLMPVIILRSPTDGWREGVRNRFLRGTLKALRLARAYIVGTEWLKRELATWLGDDVGAGQPQRLQGAAQESIPYAFAPAVGGRAQDDDGHQVVHGDDRRAALHARHHVRIAVVEDVHQLGALRLAAQPPGIQHVAGDVTLRLVQGTRQHQLRRIHVLGPPPRIAARGASVAAVACQVPDRRGQPHLESRIGALQPVVQPVGVAIHRGPALEGEIGDQQDPRHWAVYSLLGL